MAVTKTEPVKAAAVVVAAAVESVKAPSKEIMRSTEVAKAEVQKVGVQEVKERMSTKVTIASSSSSSTSVKPSASLPPPATDNQSSLSSSSMEVTERNEAKEGKKAIAKGVSLIVAAGVVAVVRNVVKAYLGRGLRP